MPHIELKMLKGRSEEQKKKVAEALKKTLCEMLPTDEYWVTCSVEDYTPEEWQQVFKTEITDKNDKLYVSPKYDPKSLL